MDFLKKLISATLILCQLVMLIGIMPVRAANPIATNFVCGQDLNNNGYLGDEGEYQACQTATINHTTAASPYCLQGYTMQANGLCMKYEYAPLGSQCPSGYFIQNGRCMTEEYLQAQAYCPSGFIVVGNGCQRVTYTNPTQSCPSGSVIQNGRCISQSQVTPSQSCIAGTAPGTYNGQAVCGWIMNNGWPNPTIGTGIPILWCSPTGQIPGLATCYINPSYICNQGTLQGNVCIVNKDNGAVTLVCPSGSQLVNGQCKKTESANLNYLCPTGTLTGNQCKVVTDGGPVQAVCNPGYVIENGQCVKSTQSQTQYSCSQGTLSGTQCVWNTQENYCPIGVNQSCLNNNGGASCSPNKCIDIGVNKPVDEGSIDGSMLVDDGKKSEDGICMDQMFIFSGRAQDCKLAGIDTAFKNCCKSEGKVFTDGVGAMGNITTAASTISKVYGAAQEAYTYYTVAMQATGDAAVASSMAAQGFGNAMVVAFDPTSLAISVAIYFAMQYLMKACDQTSMETAMQAGSGYCHEVGTYCKKKIPLLGCVQKATSYCCFNSKLARIIHEQGRPQLKNFSGWGSSGSPQCRGFTPDEFAAINFAEIDLSEYVEDMVKKATDEIQKDVNQITQDFYDKTN
ncbi:conjugal transfer protein [Salmonella enterica subsp. enterica serovar Newport]|nr:conjugal transfer protein [Salmonella enterica subsp. enterica serovar Newport]EDA1371525.1 conjugal transfer protein [Salmonella enterica subsp. enterica serovar Typhimurium]